MEHQSLDAFIFESPPHCRGVNLPQRRHFLLLIYCAWKKKSELYFPPFYPMGKINLQCLKVSQRPLMSNIVTLRFKKKNKKLNQIYFPWFSPSSPRGPGHISADITWRTRVMIHPEARGRLWPNRICDSVWLSDALGRREGPEAARVCWGIRVQGTRAHRWQTVWQGCYDCCSKARGRDLVTYWRCA